MINYQLSINKYLPIEQMGIVNLRLKGALNG